MRLCVMSLAVVLVGCGGPTPRPTPEVMPEVAAELGALYESWDGARMLALYAEPRAGRVSPARFVWLREQLGSCGAPEFMWSVGKRGARFRYPCERGAMELQIHLDAAGKIVKLWTGATDIPTPPALHDAAVAVLASLPWEPGAQRPFENNLDAVRRHGRCQLVRPWVVGQRGAMFHAICEHGDATVLRVGLHADGTLAQAELLGAGEVYQGPPVSATYL